MAARHSIIFLFNVSNEIEHSFQSPVIFFTETDFADTIYNSLLTLSQYVDENMPPEEALQLVHTFHYDWFYSVKKIEKFRKNLESIPREVILRAIDFTIKCLKNRYDFLRNNYERMQSALSSDEKLLMSANLDIISEIQQIHHNALVEKQENILKQADTKEYFNQIYDEIKELLFWLDRQYDNLAFQYSKVLALRVPIVSSDLTKILKQIIDELANAPDPESQRITGLIHSTSKSSQTIPVSALQELEITRLVIKIKVLEDRIDKSEDQNSHGLMALRHRLMYLKNKVESLQNIKKSLMSLHAAVPHDEISAPEDRIFNHILPLDVRHRLVDRLIMLWNNAMKFRDHESIISILSVADLKEVFSDTIGEFTVDKYGRKIYSKNNELYQLNEKNELVLVKDDKDRAYFYDDCGRYYLNAKSQRVYKAHDDASEYLLNSTGILFKIKEVINGTEYFYDCLGRYYIDKQGKHIYHEDGRTSEYEFDGIGNLVKISKKVYYHEAYKRKPLVIEDNQYLQEAVGPALKKCIANVILHRPTDPIAYLADCLVRYKLSMVEQQKNIEDEKERFENTLLYTTKDNSTLDFELKDYEMRYDVQEEENDY